MTTASPAPAGPVSVLQVLACDAVGGTEAMVAALVERMDPGRVRSVVATLAAPGPLAARLRAAAVETHPLGGGGSWRAPLRLAGLLRRGRYDVVNAYGLRATVLARLVARLVSPRPAVVCGVRGLLVTETEDLDGIKARCAAFLERLLHPLVDVYDANSTGALELMARQGIDRGRLRYIPNGIDVASWPTADGDQPQGEPPLVVCVARFFPRKRQQDLVEALAALRRSGVPFRAVLGGDGPTRAEIAALVDARGLGDVVELPGALDPPAVADLLTRAAVFCLPSAWEGMPGAVMEAMAAGRPVVGTRVNGTEDLVVDGVTGRLVPPRDPAALADALREVLGDPARGQEWGRAGRQRLEEHFTLERMVRAKEDLYLELAGSR